MIVMFMLKIVMNKNYCLIIIDNKIGFFWEFIDLNFVRKF